MESRAPLGEEMMFPHTPASAAGRPVIWPRRLLTSCRLCAAMGLDASWERSAPFGSDATWLINPKAGSTRLTATPSDELIDWMALLAEMTTSAALVSLEA